jgi:hypothetical protein
MIIGVSMLVNRRTVFVLLSTMVFHSVVASTAAQAQEIAAGQNGESQPGSTFALTVITEDVNYASAVSNRFCEAAAPFRQNQEQSGRCRVRGILSGRFT